MVDDETLTRIAATLCRGWEWLSEGSTRAPHRPSTLDFGRQSNRVAPKRSQSKLGVSKDERLLQEGYVNRCQEILIRSALYDKCRENEAMERALKEARSENNDLAREVTRIRARTIPEQIVVVVATSRGERYHLPRCGNIRNSTGVKKYSPCLACLGQW